MNREAEEFRISSDIKEANNEVLRGRLEQAELALQAIAYLPIAEQDDMPAANMRAIAKQFLASQQGEQVKHPEQAECAQGEREAFDACCASMIDCTDEVNRDWLWRFVQRWDAARAALAQLPPVVVVVEDRETPEIVGYRSGTSGGIYAEGYGLEKPEPLMTVAQHDRMALERWQYFRRKMRQMRDLMRNVAGQRNDWRDKADAAQARVAELEKQEPVAVVDCGDDGYWADILPDRTVKVGQKLYAAPVAQAGQVPECFRLLLKHAHGMTTGVDWNKGTAAGHHREPLGEAVVQCQAWLAAAPALGGSTDE